MIAKNIKNNLLKFSICLSILLSSTIHASQQKQKSSTPKPAVLRIAQITDTHIMPKGKHWRNNPNAKTAERLEAVIDHINNLLPKPDMVIHTGDITETADIDSYKHAKELLDKLTVPYYLMCGNHDRFANLKKVFTDHCYFVDPNFSHYTIDTEHVRIVVLDTTVDGKSYGELCEQRKSWLIKTLKNSSKDTLIFFHHFPTQIEGLHKYNLLNGDELEQIISSYKNVIGLFCGHFHYMSASVLAGKMCWISQSTAPPRFIHYHVRELNLCSPAYSLHLCYGDGTTTSYTIPVVLSK